ncbi:lysophospholipid acyltransferase family protein [Pseudomarimonas salicorniae]|uniref:Lysophospholipid acyltransferase family protein n=1 Tax=Pseudomarimonas salicorniae TaxID=2933270 RepID=A0ABT0GKJ6_9GAMM|nr:lysophospholipid acyltransferase family protein [Lysobacter sp. CAU 1642]MCK7595056.1 lysophospholipid acyltransferase family protein [Lysobacter sp. CAU 1642]
MGPGRVSGPIRAPLPPRAPRHGNAFTRWIGRTVLRLGGWRVEGEWPDVDKLLIIAAPHSSAWDGIWGLAAKLALGIELHIMAKAELFRGLSGLTLGPLLRWFGAVPINRHAANGVVGQTVEAFNRHRVFWLILAPEGTRRRVEHWRSGFWHIARQAGVPVLCAWFHYPDRLIGIGQLFQPTADREADMAALREYYRPYVGKRRGTV